MNKRLFKSSLPEIYYNKNCTRKLLSNLKHSRVQNTGDHFGDKATNTWRIPLKTMGDYFDIYKAHLRYTTIQICISEVCCHLFHTQDPVDLSFCWFTLTFSAVEDHKLPLWDTSASRPFQRRIIQPGLRKIFFMVWNMQWLWRGCCCVLVCVCVCVYVFRIFKVFWRF